MKLLEKFIQILGREEEKWDGCEVVTPVESNCGCLWAEIPIRSLDLLLVVEAFLHRTVFLPRFGYSEDLMINDVRSYGLFG